VKFAGRDIYYVIPPVAVIPVGVVISPPSDTIEFLRFTAFPVPGLLKYPTMSALGSQIGARTVTSTDVPTRVEGVMEYHPVFPAPVAP